MSVRRSRRLNRHQPDASFQISLAVDATSNDLLLEGNDTLQNDFFADGSEFTMSTPLPTRATASRRGLRARTPRPNPLVEDVVPEEPDEASEHEEPDVTPKAQQPLPSFGTSRLPALTAMLGLTTNPPDTMFQDNNPALSDFYQSYPSTPKGSSSASMPLPEFFTPAPIRFPVPSPTPQSALVLDSRTAPIQASPSPIKDPATSVITSISQKHSNATSIRVPPPTDATSNVMQPDLSHVPSKLQRPMKPLRRSMRQSRSSSPVKPTTVIHTTQPSAQVDRGEGSSIPRSRRSKVSRLSRKGSGRNSIDLETSPASEDTESVAIDVHSPHSEEPQYLPAVPESGELLEQQPEEPETVVGLAALRLDDHVSPTQSHLNYGEERVASVQVPYQAFDVGSTHKSSSPFDFSQLTPPPEEKRAVAPSRSEIPVSFTPPTKRFAEDDQEVQGEEVPRPDSHAPSNKRTVKRVRIEDTPEESGPFTSKRFASRSSGMKTTAMRKRPSGPRLSGSNGRNLLGKSKSRPKPLAASRRKPGGGAAHPHTAASGTARSVSASAKPSKASMIVDAKPRIKATPGCGLTIPSVPTFPSDILRRQRALVKAESQMDEDGADAETDNGTKDRNAKPGAAFTGARGRVPLSDRQASQTMITQAPTRLKFATAQKPTVPHAFHFESDLRLNLRKQVVEKKTENGGVIVVSGPGASQRIIPDFKSVQAEQAAKRREVITPTVPHSPNFVLEMRIKEREKFEEARRQREEELKREEEERRREEEENQERAWREARKMTVPKANAIPDWYASVPKKEYQV